MFESLIMLIITLAIIFGVWYLVKWGMSRAGVGSPLPTIVDIVFGVVGLIVLLRFLAGFI